MKIEKITNSHIIQSINNSFPALFLAVQALNGLVPQWLPNVFESDVQSGSLRFVGTVRCLQTQYIVVCQ